MFMTDLIAQKRDGGRLSREEIEWMISGYVKGDIPDYQMSAMLMAIYLNGMDHQETVDLTMAMTHSGDTLDLSGISGVKADKHSTGGVGDKTSLALCPMVAALGVKIAKMSGRGLGHTGGTLDKLESIPGFSTQLSFERFLKNAEETGLVICGQTANLTPADKLLYALRDVTGTVGCRPLIVSSIMSKKLAAGADIIVLDVKTGSGAFMKTEEESFALAGDMVEVGKAAGRQVMAVVTDMDQPLGNAVGNALEVKEAIALLKGEYTGDLLELCMELGSGILTLSGAASNERQAREMLMGTIEDGSALEKLAEMVRAQGGDPRAVYDVSLLPQAEVIIPVPSEREGFVKSISADKVGLISMHLGGGRRTKEDGIDPGVGVMLVKKNGDYVKKGDALAYIHAADGTQAECAAEMLRDSYVLSPEAPAAGSFIKGVVT